jgi:hypothetical protein
VEKLMMLSIILVSVAVPLGLSARPAPRRAVRRAQWIVISYVFVWAYLCISWYPRFVPVE